MTGRLIPACSHQYIQAFDAEINLKFTKMLLLLRVCAAAMTTTHTLHAIRKSVQDFTESRLETQIGARTWRIVCSFRPYTCAYMDILHWK
jgi:hypothetical protein